jgi:hypothetical protein
MAPQGRLPLAALGWRGRAAIASILLAIALMAGTAVIAFNGYQRVAWDLIVARDEQLAFLAATRLGDELGKYADVLESVSRSLTSAAANSARPAAALVAAGPDLAVFDQGVVWLDQRGVVRAVHPYRADLLGQNWSTKDLFRRQLTSSGSVLGDVDTAGVGHGPLVALSVPVRGEIGEFEGALVGLFGVGAKAVSPLYASIVRLRIGQGGTTYVLDGNGLVLFDSEYREVAIPLDDRGPRDLPRLDRPGAVRTVDEQGYDVIAAFAPVPGTTWSVLAEEDADRLVAPIIGYRRLLYTLMGLGMALPIAGVAMMLRRGAARPLAAWPQDALDAETWARALLPRQLPAVSGWRFDARRAPSAGGGVETYDCLLRPDGSVVLAVVRAMGDGTAGAHTVSVARCGLRSAALQGAGPGDGLAQANDLLSPETSGVGRVDVLCATLDPYGDSLIVASGGECVAFACAGLEVRVLASGGSPLGDDPGRPFSEGRIDLSGVDALVLAGPGAMAAMAAAAGGNSDAVEAAVVAISRAMAKAREESEPVLAILQGALSDAGPVAPAKRPGWAMVVAERDHGVATGDVAGADRTGGGG